jgi:ribosome recycling factor
MDKELVKFCKLLGLNTQGDKQELYKCVKSYFEQHTDNKDVQEMIDNKINEIEKYKQMQNEQLKAFSKKLEEYSNDFYKKQI